MLLFTGRNSICTQKVLITMFEKNLSWETKRVDLFRNEQYDAEYLKYNPKGVVPTLVNDGQVIVESTLICEYLEDTFPVPSLVPEAPYERSQMRLWSKHVDEGLFEATREISFSAMFRDKLRNMSEEQRQIRFRNIGDPARSARFMSTYEQGVESPYVFYGIAAFEKLFRHMSDVLTERREWLVGTTVIRRHQFDAVCGTSGISQSARSFHCGSRGRTQMVATLQNVAQLPEGNSRHAQ